MMLYASLMISTRKIPIKINREKKSKHITTEKSTKYKKKRAREAKRNKRTINRQKIVNKMSIVNPFVSIIILNVNRLNSSTKGPRIPEWIKKTRLNYMLSATDSL